MDDDRRGKVTRVNDGGEGWDWQAEWQGQWERRRPGLPLFGVFLILLGLFLILNTYVEVTKIAGSVFFLVIGLILLGVWARDRGHPALYLGAVITALSLADLLTGLNVVHGDGWGTFLLGIAFLAIAAIRGAGGGGWGWQVVLGVVFAVVGGSQVAGAYGAPDLNRVAVPLLIILLGLWVVTRERTARLR